MDALRTLSERKVFVLGLGILLGITIGVLYAWVIQPVEWVNGTPADLREDIRVDYLRMAIDSYASNLDADLALERFDALGEFGSDTLDLVGKTPAEVDPSAIQKFQALIAVEEPGDEEPESDATTSTAASGSTATQYILPVCGATIGLGALLALALFLRRRLESRESDQFEDVFEAPEQEMPISAQEVFEPVAEATEVASEQALATFRTTFTIGDDLYDDSFSIESPATGDFLGECGVGIAEAIGVGEPKKVSAFEVWLFDKNDIQTVTKILLSGYSFKDDETRTRLAAKGDPVQAESGEVVVLDTASLRVEARIVDMSYGSGALPQESFFERMTIELKAIAKA
jgi:hypothetical protein